MTRETELCEYRTINDSGTIKIRKTVKASRLTNFYTHYYYIDKDNQGIIKPLDKNIAEEAVARALEDDNISAALVFSESPKPSKVNIDFNKKSEMEQRFTSTGIKFWKHQEAMCSYKRGDGHSVISTHISPEGSCNLRCPYCSVTNRGPRNRIEFADIVTYLEALIERGLKAVIITGGGEPVLYPEINKLVRYIKYERGLDVALITNGTVLRKLEKDVRKAFSWLRVSVNIFNGWQDKISIPDEILNSSATIGLSYVYTAEHAFETRTDVRQLDIFKAIQKLMDRYNAKYLRVLPNCLIMGDVFDVEHAMIEHLIKEINDPRIFHQLKKHRTPTTDICHQSYFRPYLSEEINPLTRKSGTVFPCDSLVLNDSVQKFIEKFALCEPSHIKEYLDRKILPNFNPSQDCSGCVFTNNLDLIDGFVKKDIDHFSTCANKPLSHVNFV